MTIKEEVEQFIKRFHPESEDVVDVFTCGCCYWFAFILRHRFFTDDSEIMIDKVMNHFGTRIGDRVYDITGDVTDEYFWTPWCFVDDEKYKSKIIRDCIEF